MDCRAQRREWSSGQGCQVRGGVQNGLTANSGMAINPEKLSIKLHFKYYVVEHVVNPGFYLKKKILFKAIKNIPPGHPEAPSANSKLFVPPPTHATRPEFREE